jgi:mono/diheme cytochrome c family protein
LQPDLAEGESLYGAQCVSCHGADGHGDTPLLNNATTVEAMMAVINDASVHADGSLCKGDCALHIATYIDQVVALIPPPPTPVVAVGEGLYGSQCVSCHGSDGYGDTPLLINATTVDAMITVINDASVHTDGSLCKGDCAVHIAAYIDQVISLIEAPQSADLTLGESLYTEQCASCHAADGRGNTPLFVNAITVDEIKAIINDPTVHTDTDLCKGGCATHLAGYIDQVIAAMPEPQNLACSAEETPSPRSLRLLTNREYQNTVDDLFSLNQDIEKSLPGQPQVHGYNNNSDVTAVNEPHIDAYIAAAELLAEQVVTNNMSSVLSCVPSGDGSACATQFITEAGYKIWRRPLSATEIIQYEQFFAAELTDGVFDEGVRLALQAFLVSPNFLYRSELGVAEGDYFRLTPYEVASWLSYTYWGTMPDANLFSAAENNALATPEQVEAQARRLLGSIKARAQLSVFAQQWLGTIGLLAAEKDAAIYPDFSSPVREAMFDEVSQFVNHVVFDSTQTFSELFTANYVFVNDVLAQYYGLPIPNNSMLEQSYLDAGASRGGLLTLGGVLATHGKTQESSPIKRGLFVRDRLLCQTIPAPPASLTAIPPGLDPSLTTRERFSVHSDDPVCSSCHKYIDDVGFGFESYDGSGAYRTVENGLAIDDSGSMLGLESLGDTTATPFNGPKELGALMMTSESAQICVNTHYFRFAMGHAETSLDQCTIDNLSQSFVNSGQNLYEMLVNMTQMNNFSVRR